MLPPDRQTTRPPPWLTHWVILAALLIIAGCGAPPRRDEALVALGQRLLAERRLSADSTTSCLDCHQPARGYTDGQPTATPGGLNTPPLWGLNARTHFGWFSPEITSLETMVLRPLAAPSEMGPLDEATLTRLRADPVLRTAYNAAFPDDSALVTWEQTTAALAAAVRAIPTPPGPYQAMLEGDAEALSPAAQRGEALFIEVGCAACHRAPTFASESYHSVGIPAVDGRNDGRARVPSLRGLTHTAPYFHDGSAATLEEVVRHYAGGGRSHGVTPSPAITPLQLTEEDLHDLVAFLEAL